jgi:uncharacterized phage protein gp47/JayE|nr:MAG TPA: Baseplate J like protein [Bacteriophage sp.]
MYENVTYEDILQRMLDRVPDTLDKREGSIIYDALAPAAVELQLMYIELDVILKETFANTSSMEYLSKRAAERGIFPKPATHAILKGEFTPETIDVVGKRFNIGEINYVVTKNIMPGKYEVQCEETGDIGNKYLGQMIPIDYISGLETAILTEVLIPGKDKEETEVFRQRYFESFNQQSFGGNRADYLAKVRSIDGVGNCKVTRIWNRDIRPADMIPSLKVTEWFNSIKNTLDIEVATWLSNVYIASYEKKLTVGGTVLITVVNSLDYGIASDVLLNKIQVKLDPNENTGEGYGLAPIGHVVNVKSVDAVNVNISTHITFNTGYSWINLKTKIEDVVKQYLLELRKEWATTDKLTVRISKIEAQILTIDGILDIYNTCINGKAENLELTKFQIPVLGSVNDGS